MGTHSSTTIATAFTMQSLLVLTCLTLASAAPGHHGHSSSSAMGRGSFQRLALAPAAPSKNIAELAIATPQLSTLLAAVKAAGLVDTLAGEGPFAVFCSHQRCLRQGAQGRLEQPACRQGGSHRRAPPSRRSLSRLDRPGRACRVD